MYVINYAILGKTSNTSLGVCNYCNFTIWNKLYHCSICPNFNLCENCFETKRHGISHVFFYTNLKLDEKKSLDIKLNSFYPEGKKITRIGIIIIYSLSFFKKIFFNLNKDF